jgi:hypothetical protein
MLRVTGARICDHIAGGTARLASGRPAAACDPGQRLPDLVIPSLA